MESNLTNEIAVVESIHKLKEKILESIDKLSVQMPERKEELEIIKRHIK